MRSVYLVIVIIFFFSLSVNPLMAAQSEVREFSANAALVEIVEFTGGNLITGVDPIDGDFDEALFTEFDIGTNQIFGGTFTLGAAVNTADAGLVPAIFNITALRFIIFSNRDDLPSLDSIIDIRNISSDPANNPNAIAYSIDDPIVDFADVEFNNARDEWIITTPFSGLFAGSIEVPSLFPLTNTYSTENDAAGTYVTTLILTFVG